MYACVCGKKPFLAGGNPFRPAINTVIRLDLPYNPHLIGDTQLLLYDLYLKKITLDIRHNYTTSFGVPF